MSSNKQNIDYIIEEARGYLYLLQLHDPSICDLKLTFHSNALGDVCLTVTGRDYDFTS